MEALRAGFTPAELTPRRGTYPAAALGAVVTYRELTRAEYLAATEVDAAYIELRDDGLRYLTATGITLRTAETVAAGVIDPETGARLWSGADVMNLPRRLWPDVQELERRILALSEVGAEAFQGGGAQDDSGGTA